MNLLTEKYRPTCREDIVGNKAVVDQIFEMVKSGKLTHMILEGPSGTGKTTTARVIAKTLFKDFYHTNYKEMNASNSRLIDDVRGEIITFAKTTPFGADFKIILLDEGDEMTPAAQNALRGPMETYSGVTIFLFAVNHAYKIIDAIKSRCQVFHFGPISIDDIALRLTNIYMQETKCTAILKTEEDACRKIAELAQGDMRHALNHLQVMLSTNSPLTVEKIDETSIINYGKLIFDSLQKGRFLEARKHLWDALSLGYSNREILMMLHKVYITEEIDILDMKKSVFEIAETDYRLTLGVDPILALDKLLMSLIKV